jgi:hypothetical protein
MPPIIKKIMPKVPTLLASFLYVPFLLLPSPQFGNSPSPPSSVHDMEFLVSRRPWRHRCPLAHSQSTTAAAEVGAFVDAKRAEARLQESVDRVPGSVGPLRDSLQNCGPIL